MSSSGKGGSANQSKMVYGSGVIALGWGPWDWLSAVIHNGNYLFQGSLTLSTDVTDLTGAIADPSYLAPGGYLKLRRGTETQSADFTGRRNLGTVTLECRHLLFGQDTGTAPNLQVIGGGLPRVPTTIVAGADNVADDGQVNPIACWAEILLDERGGNLPEAVFDAASWLAAANWAYVNRAVTFISPLLNEQSALRAIAKRLLDPFHGFCRWTKDGKLACRVYEWGVDPGGLTTLDARHFKSQSRIRIPLGDWDEVRTEYVVSYTDRDYQFQGNTVIVPNALASQIRQVDDQGQLARPDVMRRAQAFRQGNEYNRRMGTAPSKATLPLRRPVLDALALTVGDKVKIDTDPEPGGTSLAQLCRIEGIRWDSSDAATLEVVTDNLVPATTYTPAYTTPTTPADDAPPLVYFLGVVLPPAVFGLPRAVAMLATRPSADVVRFLLYFSNSSGGSYDELGIQSGFAVRAQLAASIIAGDTALQLTELDGLNGPDAEIAANTPGGNPTAAANNTLLALLCTLDGNGRIAMAGNGNPVMEFVSIQARTFVAGATHNYTVLRGRLGTTAQAWPNGTVAWIVPRDHLVEWRHELFDSLAGAPAFFRLVSATATAIDDTIPVPQCAVNMLPESSPMMVAARPEGYYSPNLTNDRHTVASNAEGTVLAGELGVGGRAWTDVEAFAASTGLTAVAASPGPGQFSFTAAVASGTATLTKESNSRLRVDTLTSLEAKIAVTVNFEGVYTAVIEWIVWKNLSGGAYSLVPSVSVVKRNNAGAYTPANVTFQALAKLSAAAPAAYAGRFKIAYWNGAAWVDDYVSAVNESSKNYTPPAGIAKFRCQLYQAGSFSNFLDEEEIPIVDDGSPGAAGAGLFTPLADAGITDLGGGSFEKTGGSGSAWDRQVSSQESFVNGAYVSFRPHQADKNVMVGLNTDPAADSNYTSIDYAFFCEADGTLDIYESSVPATYNVPGGYSPTSVLTIIYDGAEVRYLVDGTVVRTVAAAANLKLHMDSSFYSMNARVNSVRFGPSGSKGDPGADGADGADGAPGGAVVNSASGTGNFATTSFTNILSVGVTIADNNNHEITANLSMVNQHTAARICDLRIYRDTTALGSIVAIPIGAGPNTPAPGYVTVVDNPGPGFYTYYVKGRVNASPGDTDTDGVLLVK